MVSKKFFLFRRTDPIGSNKRFSDGGSDIPILGIPAEQVAFITAGRGSVNITFNGAGMYEENELFIGDSIEKTNVTISCKEGSELRLIEKIILFASKDDGKTIMRFDVLEEKAAFSDVIISSVTDLNTKIKSQPTEMVSQKISAGDPATRFRNIVGGINFGSRDNKPFLDYNHELLTGSDESTITLWRNSGTGSSAYNLTQHGSGGNVTVETDTTAATTGLSKTCAQFAVDTFLNIPDVTIEDDYTMYFVIGDPGEGTNSFGQLFGDDAGETLGFSSEGYNSLFTMRHDGLTGKPFEVNSDTDESGSIKYNFPDKSKNTDIGGRQFCYVFVIRRDKDFNVYLHNHEGEIVAFVPAFTEKSTSRIVTKIKSKPTDISKGIYEKTTTPITSKITAGTTGRTDGNLLLQQLGSSGSNTTSSFSGTLARFGVIKRDIGDGGSSQLAKDLYELYKPIS
tara:strand:+ start:3979 stop:5337 length:1359 start_codon:yes stop_codon:yes gene_type:complete